MEINNNLLRYCKKNYFYDKTMKKINQWWDFKNEITIIEYWIY